MSISDRNNKVYRFLHPQTLADWGLRISLKEFLDDPEGRAEYEKYIGPLLGCIAEPLCSQRGRMVREELAQHKRETNYEPTDEHLPNTSR